MSGFIDGVNKFYVMYQERNAMHFEPHKSRIEVAKAMLRSHVRRASFNEISLKEAIKEVTDVKSYLSELEMELAQDLADIREIIDATGVEPLPE